jgi:hypothetical protein
MSNNLKERPNAYCGHCGSGIESHSKFCAKCGSPSVPGVSPTKPSDHARRWILVAVSAVIGLSALAVSAMHKIGIAAALAQPTASRADAATTSPSVPLGDANVFTVRAGVLVAPYNTTTIGKAFEATFTDCKWESGQSSKGVLFVDFTGMLKPEVYREAFEATLKSALERHTACLANNRDDPSSLKYCELPDEQKFSRVKFQFLFTADGQSFIVGYFDPEPWKNVFQYAKWNPNAIAGLNGYSLADVMAYIYQ